MLTNSEIRAEARESLEYNWTGPVLATLVYVAISACLSCIPLIGVVFSIFIALPLTYSYEQMFLHFVRGDKDGCLEKLGACSQNYKRALLVPFLVRLFTALWTVVFIIPGFVKAYSYAMANFVALDNPELSAIDCIDRSTEMMNGHKWELFMLDLSFIGWGVLSVLTLGIGLFWLQPYISTSHAHFYEELKANALDKRDK